MKKISILFSFFFIISCDDSSVANASNALVSSSIPKETITPIQSKKSLRSYIFGHSLINHATDTPETTVPHWMYVLAKDAGKKYRFSGQFGFLLQHKNLPPVAQWGFEHIPSIWDDDSPLSFADVNFDSVLLTAANFIQYRGPSETYEGDNPTKATPVSASLEIIDWVTAQEPGILIYIYEGWPDMGGFLANQNEFKPTSAEIAAYHAATVNLNSGRFHRWWLDYQDKLIRSRPDLEIKLIPVGPIISYLLTDTALAGIDIHTLYEDDAPHGKPTIYFLASLVTYMAMYGERPPADFDIPKSIHRLVKDNYSLILAEIWSKLNAFNFSDGTSRVF